jgi:hypothetical protein
VKQLELLEARRRMLLARCALQRAELAYRFERVAPGTQLSRWTSWAARWGRSASGAPLAFWGMSIALALLLLKPRRLLGRLAWVTTAVSLVSRASHILRLIGQWRAIRSGLR